MAKRKQSEMRADPIGDLLSEQADALALECEVCGGDPTTDMLKAPGGRLYESGGDEPERTWDEIDENVQEEWRGDARSVLQVALSQPVLSEREERLGAALREIVEVYNDDSLTNSAAQDKTDIIARTALSEQPDQKGDSDGE